MSRRHQHREARGRGAAVARSLPHRGPYVGAMFLAVLHWLSIVATVTLGYIVFRIGNPSANRWFLVAAVLVVVTWIAGFLRRRSIKCPLCKGTPLLDSAAVHHRDASRIPPLNFGTSALVRLVTTQRFRCMYCGSLFDLLKKPGQRLR